MVRHISETDFPSTDNGSEIRLETGISWELVVYVARDQDRPMQWPRQHTLFCVVQRVLLVAETNEGAGWELRGATRTGILTADVAGMPVPSGPILTTFQ